MLKETLIELSLWLETYIMRVSVSNGCVLETWGSWVRGFGRCEGIRSIRNGGSQPHIHYLPFVIGVRFDSSSESQYVRRTTTGRDFWSENTEFFWSVGQLSLFHVFIIIIIINMFLRVRRASCSLIVKMKLVPPSLPRSSCVPSSFWLILYCLFRYSLCAHHLYVL